MKRILRLIKHDLVFIFVVILTNSANADIKSTIWSLDENVSMEQNNAHDSSDCDQCGNTSNSIDEVHDDDGELLHQNHFAPFGYCFFIPSDPIPLENHFLPPLKRPPRA